MEKRRFFKRKHSTHKDSNLYTNADICNVNIVSEAEKIIEEYVSKMGYSFGKKRYTCLKTFALLSLVLLGFTAVVAATLKLLGI